MAWSELLGVSISAGVGDFTSGSYDTMGVTFLVVSTSAYYGGLVITTVSDNKSNTWVPLTAKNDFSNITRTQLWYVVNPTVGSGHTFTVTGSAGNFYSVMGILGMTGQGASPFESENSNEAVSSFLLSGSVTPTQNGDLIVSAMCAASGTGFAVSGYTSHSVDYTAAVNMGGGIAWFEQPTAGAENPNWTWSGGSTQVTGVTACFKGSGVGGGGGKPHYYYQQQRRRQPKFVRKGHIYVPSHYMAKAA